MFGIERTDNGCAAIFAGTNRTRIGFWYHLREMGWACISVRDGYCSLRIWRFAFTKRPDTKARNGTTNNKGEK